MTIRTANKIPITSRANSPVDSGSPRGWLSEKKRNELIRNRINLVVRLLKKVHRVFNNRNFYPDVSNESKTERYLKQKFPIASIVSTVPLKRVVYSDVAYYIISKTEQFTNFVNNNTHS